MKKNIETIDRVIRVLIAVLIAFIYFSNVITGTLGLILIAISVVLVITSFISFCPLYFLVGIKSNKKHDLVN